MIVTRTYAQIKVDVAQMMKQVVDFAQNMKQIYTPTIIYRTWTKKSPPIFDHFRAVVF